MVAQINAARDKAAQARAALEHAEDLAGEAHHILAGALAGVVHLEPDTARMPAAFDAVTDGCKGHWWPMLNEAMKGAETIAARVEAAATVSPAVRPPAQPQPRPAPARRVEPDDPPTVPPERIEAIRRALPPPVVPRSGQRTVGQWIGPNGQARTVESGWDQRSAQIQTQLARKGLPEGTKRSGDVELKVAADMVARGIRHAEVVINHVTCKGPDSCDTLVPVLLPEGSTLTVHGINQAGTRTRVRYTGGATPPWQV
ncbi:hypothetical protein FHS29_004643 [Saccharothrix tamanrassetensis]|uniref:Nucleic acid/nucleotide deaminase of polymorphic system toxin n=1 Tax=Saccharothrix tamanrassetensis TaxID=1051531 RepID=A0A841CPW1_9PSEU|nr:DddA-like double-stranded DNA deaminase toxin [Saccharothrix tamanrassetensis]MBB5958035.1 hypothetical protein [Saccharothrix tamanrassetensis]